jgi:hypothetical protein
MTRGQQNIKMRSVQLQGSTDPTPKTFETLKTENPVCSHRAQGECNTQANGRENYDTRTGIW